MKVEVGRDEQQNVVTTYLYQDEKGVTLMARDGHGGMHAVCTLTKHGTLALHQLTSNTAGFQTEPTSFIRVHGYPAGKALSI